MTEPTSQPDMGEPAKVDKQRVFSEFTPTQIEGMRGLVFTPRNFEEVWFLADFFSRAGAMVPEIYRGNKEACAMAIMWGLELQISPLQAITGITVVGGAPKVWGDLQHALVLTHPDFESFREWTETDPQEGLIAFCEVKRKGHDPVVRQFSARDAIVAGLAGKDTHKKYPKRMLPMRARSWAERDAMPHALRGLGNADEMIDVEARVTATAPLKRGDPAGVMMPEALEHEPNPLNDLVMPTTRVDPATVTRAVDFADLETDFAGTGERMVEAEPGATLTGTEVDEDAALAERERLQRVRDASPAQATLLGEPPVRKALSPGEEQLLRLELGAAGGTVTDQDVVDEIGDVPHGGNIKQAIAAIKRLAADGRMTK